METATLRPTHARLARLAGAYAGTESVYHEAGGATGETTGRFRTNMGLGGNFLVIDYQQEQFGSITRLVHAVVGVDASSGRPTLHWFDDRGEDPGAPALGDWQGDDLVFERRTSRGAVRLAFGAPLTVVIDNLGEPRTSTATAVRAGLVTIGTELAGAGTV